MAGTIVADTLQDGAGNSTATTNAIMGSAKAWVRFTGVTTVTVSASFNVSSVTRSATGNYTINLTTALTDANYSVIGMSQGQSAYLAGTWIANGTTPTSSSVNIYTGSYATLPYDAPIVCIAFFR